MVSMTIYNLDVLELAAFSMRGEIVQPGHFCHVNEGSLTSISKFDSLGSFNMQMWVKNLTPRREHPKNPKMIKGLFETFTHPTW